jgi:hypothetical protein
MRDLAALLTSLINIDRHSLIAILTAEAEAAQRSVKAARQPTASQRAKRLHTEDHLARIERMLCFFQRGEIATQMSAADVELCTSVEQRLHGPGST